VDTIALPLLTTATFQLEALREAWELSLSLAKSSLQPETRRLSAQICLRLTYLLRHCHCSPSQIEELDTAMEMLRPILKPSPLLSPLMHPR
jgi:hypothetical protein